MIWPSRKWKSCRGRHYDGQAGGQEEPAGGDRATDGGTTATPERWPVRGRRPKRVYGDRVCDSCLHRMLLCDRSIQPLIAQRNTEGGSGLGRVRLVIERRRRWLRQFRRLHVHHGHRNDIDEGLLSVGCARIRWNTLHDAFCQALYVCRELGAIGGCAACL
jgi:hypothetical protein